MVVASLSCHSEVTTRTQLWRRAIGLGVFTGLLLFSIGLLWQTRIYRVFLGDDAFQETLSLDSAVLSLPWEQGAEAKRQTIMRKIPKQWHLEQSVIDKARKHLKLTGTVIESLLDTETIQITSIDSVDLISAISNGSRTAVSVTRAFCKRAAIAHQLVSFPTVSRII